jgi:hypothetical protein
MNDDQDDAAVRVQETVRPVSPLEAQRAARIGAEIQQFPLIPYLAVKPPPAQVLSGAQYMAQYGLRGLTSVPENFNWMDQPYITEALNQHTCGDCWAFSMATVMSDRFAIALKNAGKTPLNPYLSPSSVTFCVSEADTSNGGQPCGSPRNSNFCLGNCTTLESYRAWAQSPGIASMKCVAGNQCSNPNKVDVEDCDFKWCLAFENMTNSPCERLTDADYNTIGGCAHINGNCTLYKIQNPIALAGFTQDPVTSKANHLLIMSELVNNGPLTANFGVPADFKLWYKYNQTPEDVYVMQDSEIRGGHAVVIVGYGAGYLTYTDIQTDHGPYKRYKVNKTPAKPDQKKVEYWIVRNSWGTGSGYKGLFNILMPSSEAAETRRMMATNFADVVYGASPVLTDDVVSDAAVRVADSTGRPHVMGTHPIVYLILAGMCILLIILVIRLRNM